MAGIKRTGRLAERTDYFRYVAARLGVFFNVREDGMVVMRILHRRMDV